MLRSVVLGLLIASTIEAASVADEPTMHTVIDNLQLNSRGVSSFDVLVSEARFCDKGKLGYKDARAFTRIVCDRVTKRCAQYTIGELKALELGKQNTLEPRTKQIIAATIINDGLAYCLDGSSRSTLNSESFGASLSRSQIKMFDFVGVLPFPVSNIPITVGQRQTHVQSLRDEVWSKVRVFYGGFKHIRNAPSPSFSFEKKDDSGTLRIEKVICHGVSMLPVQRSILFSESGGSERPKLHHFFKWQEVNGVSVPSEISEDDLQVEVGIDEERVEFELNESYKMHWFSVNGKIDESLFDLQNLDDYQLIRDVTDPIKSNASSLNAIHQRDLPN